MTRFAAALFAVLPALMSCSGEEVVPPPPPEICDDGIDNDGDGLVDCDDEACGGLACRDPGDDDDTGDTEPPPIVEVVFDSDNCCDFSFTTPGDCQKPIGTFDIINRSEEDGLIKNISCDIPMGGTVAAILFQVGDAPQKVPFVANSELDAQTQVEITAWYDCFSSMSFEVPCRAKAEVENEESEVEWDTVGTAL